MKLIIGNEPVQKMSLAGKVRMLAAATRIVSDQAILMEAAQKLDGLARLQKIEDSARLIFDEMGSRISAAAFSEFSERAKTQLKQSLKA